MFETHCVLFFAWGTNVRQILVPEQPLSSSASRLQAQRALFPALWDQRLLFLWPLGW